LKQFIGLVCVATACFAAGWISHRQFSKASIPASQVALDPTATRNETAATPGLPAERLKPAADPDNSPNETTALQAFRRALHSDNYRTAMQLIDEAEAGAVDTASIKALRSELLAYLEEAYTNGATASFMALVESHLGRYYDDIDVLLLLARFQAREGYVDESARALQMAHTYAFTPQQQAQVQSAVAELVMYADALYAEQDDWIALLGFYQLLVSIDLDQPMHELRRAALHLQLDDTATAIALVSPLLNDPSLGGEAHRLLKAIEANRVQRPSTPQARQSVPLVRRGNHYLVEVQLNGRSMATLMIDTGASITSLSQDSFTTLASISTYAPLGSRLFNTANGVTPGEVYRAKTLQLGTTLLSGVSIAVLPYEQQDGIDGLLGMNVLRAFRFEIDQDAAVLYLQPR
jgi:clan AA aspartic protease (TIGR02281 family)